MKDYVKTSLELQKTVVLPKFFGAKQLSIDPLKLLSSQKAKYIRQRDYVL